MAMQPEAGRDAGPIINISGEKVALGPVSRSLVPLYNRWLNDFAVGVPYFFGEVVPEHHEATESRYEQWLKDERTVIFTVYEGATLRPIGVADLHRINHINRTAEYGILIGERDCWGRGYGTETTALLLEYGFAALDLHSILLTVFSYNERGIRAYTRAGFKEVGRWREAKRLAGRVYDIVYMDCLATEFQGGALRPLFPSVYTEVPMKSTGSGWSPLGAAPRAPTFRATKHVVPISALV
jgi:RimJ/RimL family protein N-acetyltransferase